METKPRIFCFINNGHGTKWITVIAVAEDGTSLASHICSHESYCKHDIGITSDWKHDEYRAHYPGGYELVWSDEPDKESWFADLVAKSSALATATGEGGE